jgi:hypothetical protein
MIGDYLIPALVEKYGSQSFKAGHRPEPIAIFPAAHPEVGNLVIYDDGCEATVCVGEITHYHFNPYQSLTQEELDKVVTESVLRFLEELFSDKVILSRIAGGGGGRTESNEQITSVPSHGRDVFWSGQCAPEELAGVIDPNVETGSGIASIIGKLSSLTALELVGLIPAINETFGSYGNDDV